MRNILFGLVAGVVLVGAALAGAPPEDVRPVGCHGYKSASCHGEEVKASCHGGKATKASCHGRKSMLQNVVERQGERRESRQEARACRAEARAERKAAKASCHGQVKNTCHGVQQPDSCQDSGCDDN